MALHVQEVDLDDLSTLERSIHSGKLDDARVTVRHMLFGFARAQSSGGTIGDALAILARNPTNKSRAAIILLRCLAVPGLIPEPNSTNQIVRFTIELCERAVPEFIDFLKIPQNAQNYQKFAILSGFHERITEILRPLQSAYGDLSALLHASHDILGSLNHSIIKKYGEPYNINEVRATIQSLLSKLRKVSSLSPTLLQDLEECNRAVCSVKFELQIEESFLNYEFLGPFLNNCETVLSGFLDTLKGRFSSTIVWGRVGRELQKRYPLHEPEREIQIFVPLRNSGPGMATDVRVTVSPESENAVFGSETIMLGNVQPGDFSVTFDAMIITPSLRISALVSVEWGEIGTLGRKSDIFPFDVIAQSPSIDWQSLEYCTPYSTEVAEGADFIGRADRVRLLAAKLLRRPMESFYITGQKRVGKTSLALKAAEYAKANSPDNLLNFEYILWGSVAHADPILSMEQLGQRIELFIASHLENREWPKSNYHGSLAGLVKLSQFALTAVPDRKFVLLLDEFDDIPQELFLHGNVAETFFGNLRALSRCRNICIVLIGGENMPFIMDRQGQKLNNFSRINLSYFLRDSEWDDFQMLVRKPTADLLNWHNDAVSEVFNSTNGNPYFSKIVCAGVFRSAVSERDADITTVEVKRAIESEVSQLGANSFAHLWQDGVPKATSERGPDIIRRMKILVALGRCLRSGQLATATHIANHKMSANLSEGEMNSVLHDFVRRDVLREDAKGYEFNLPIFRAWLVDVGLSQLVADPMSEELANAVIAEENAALVRSEEVVALSKQWSTYRGKYIGSDDIRAWYQQVSNPRDQRILFEILKRTRVFSEALVRERLKTADAMWRRTVQLPPFRIQKRGDRRRDILVVYVDGEGKSGSAYASLYAEENGIAAECVIAERTFAERFIEHSEKYGRPAVLIIIDDIAATGSSLSSNLEKFVTQFKEQIQTLPIRAITVVSTKRAQDRILKKISEMEGVDIDFRSCEIVPPTEFAFPDEEQVWNSNEQESRAKALCVDLGKNIYPRTPLGYGNMGLLIVFPTTVPNNSLPILHSYSRPGRDLTWTPLFPRVMN